MRLRRHGSLLGSSLKSLSTRPILCSQCHHHQYSTGPPQNIAVIGGGITGLASAYYIAKEQPTARITIYEAGPRLGGWLHSSHVEVPGGRVLFEHGPRSLRPGMGALVTSTLIQELGMIPDVIYTDKSAASAVNRFIYYPDHLVRLPNPTNDSSLEIAFTTLREPLFKGFIPGAIGEAFRPTRPANLDDESVASFFARRLDPRVAQNIISAVLHGIYAGDVNQLSVRSIFPLLWTLEKQGGSVIRAIATSRVEENIKLLRRDRELLAETKKVVNPEFMAAMGKASVFSFRNGLQQLVDRLAETVAGNKRVTTNLGTPVTHLELEEAASGDKKMKVFTESESQTYDMVVSSIFSKTLSELCTSNSKTVLPELAKTHAVTVMVVNLFYANPKLVPVEGFGYLIPQSIPFQQNPERALGVIFDSDTIKGQDIATGTKLTVILGGHWWDGWSTYPTEDEGVAAAQSILARHLHITDDPVAAQAKLQKDCIPQYTVGHITRMKQTHSQLMAHFKGRLRVVGNSYTGVGVNDCIRAAKDIAQDLGQYNQKSGLEEIPA
ncbi:Protoporphyrinogen oxidase [Mytilinidion resinicola]|uniref:Protoporphyrinogen oxidase n=1 Tax=Mytilinidion resinicola TaxID=574789 RepID=A0A6A6YHF0_9PEZI|nr:Protoporphyrinogen oxidase [Mytilinidion resinicola]KAF2807953.1 Protoporphyrinogen oxidase [Mytilinidion resinicola]